MEPDTTIVKDEKGPSTQPVSRDSGPRDMDDFLGKPPGWITRYGVFVFLALFIGAVIMSWVIKYPEIIRGEVYLSTINPPVRIVSKTNGQIDRIFVENGDEVGKGEYLMVLGNSANTGSVLQLNEILDRVRPLLKENRYEALGQVSVAAIHNLGELQTFSQDLKNRIDDYLLFLELDINGLNKASIGAQIVQHENLNTSLNQQIIYQREDVNVRQAEYEANRKLFEKEFISEKELNQQLELLRNKKYSLESALIAQTQNEIKLSNLSNQLIELQKRDMEEETRLKTGIKDAFDQLESRVKAWEEQFVLMAPIPGQATFFGYWANNQIVNAGEEVIAVIPDTTSFTVKGKIPIVGAGKVKLGQKVKIEITDYPSQEYGYLLGKISYIAPIANSDSYNVEIELDQGLVSNFNKQIDFRYELKGSMEIITENKRFLERIFEQINELVDSNT